MRVQFYLIATLTGLIAWVAMFNGTRDLYRYGQYVGVMPNLHIKSRLSGDAVPP
ncbi:hypothetical protein D3C71_1783650 [compost metagenome]